MENLCDGDGCQIMIFGASLKVFSYTGDFFNEYLLYNSFSLKVAEIGDTGGSEDWETDEKGRQLAYRMFKLLIGLPNIKCLRLFAYAVKDLSYAVELLLNIPIFKNLTYLEFGLVDLDCAALLKILQKILPVLRP
ncbi:uncharacterized protein LOC133868754 [Alnus glutinosa]|uniref:uncharacterized protein LOC133868754 n=1 Tax=Alnus glutinosa TaxID=3517 RepID=UPI002D76C752|nr:uncharacterized protein LOC133868754 [Alnus glutinosa]